MSLKKGNSRKKVNTRAEGEKAAECYLTMAVNRARKPRKTPARSSRGKRTKKAKLVLVSHRKLPL